MKVIRTTTVTAQKGNEEQVTELMKELDGYLAEQPGLIDRYELRNAASFSRITVWASREMADRAATQVRTIALRARIHTLCEHARQDSLMPVDAEHHAITVS